MIEPPYCGAEGAFLREGADVELVEDCLVPGPSPPALVGPAIGCGIDHLARPMHILRLEARGWVRRLEPGRQREAIERPGGGLVERELVPALPDAAHGEETALR